MAEFGKGKHIFLRSGAVLLLLLASLCMYYGATIPGVIIIFAALALMRKLRYVRAPQLRRDRGPLGIKKWQWAVGAVLLAMVALAYAWLFHEAVATDGSSFVSLYVFIAAGVACFVWWSWLYMRWFKWWFF